MEHNRKNPPGGISFSGIALTVTGDAHNAFKISMSAAQLLLATRKRVGNPSFRAAETEIGDETMRRGISYLEPPANLVACKWEFLPCKSLKGKRLQHGDPSWLALSLRSPLITLGMTNWRFHFPIMHHFFKSHRLTYTEPRDYRVVFGIQ